MEDSPHAVVISCIFEGMLIEVLCSVNNSPFQLHAVKELYIHCVSACSLTLSPGVEGYNLTDSLVYQGEVHMKHACMSNALLILCS